VCTIVHAPQLIPKHTRNAFEPSLKHKRLAQGFTIVLSLPVFVMEEADWTETQFAFPRIVTAPQLPSKVIELLLPLIVTEFPLQENVRV
jgi:hypothetical protein